MEKLKITQEFLINKFPNGVKYAFISNYVVKSSLKRRPNVSMRFYTMIYLYYL